MIAARALVLVATTLAAFAGCKTYTDELARSQRAFEQNDHDRALALLRDLEPDVVRLNAAERTEYAYLRGMADYRIGYRSDARHWLMLAKASDDSSPGMLPPDWKTRTAEALTELDGVVLADGTSALGSTRQSDTNAKDAQSAAKDDAPAAKPRRKKSKDADAP